MDFLKLSFIGIFLLTIGFVSSAQEDNPYSYNLLPVPQLTNVSNETVNHSNSTDWWDLLDTPADISTSDIVRNDDGTYLLATGDTATGTYNFNSGILYIDSANSRVGVGTAIPEEQFHIQSGVGHVIYRLNPVYLYSKGQVTQYNTAGMLFNSYQNITLGGFSGPADIRFCPGDYLEPSCLHYVVGGSLGLGTATPTHKLNVVGNANITTQLVVGDDLSVGDDLDVADDAVITGDLYVDYINSSSNALNFTGANDQICLQSTSNPDDVFCFEFAGAHGGSGADVVVTSPNGNNLTSFYWRDFSFQVGGNKYVGFGSSGEFRMLVDSAGTSSSMQFGIIGNDYNRPGVISIMDRIDFTQANRRPPAKYSQDPVLRIWSEDETDANEWFEFVYNQTYDAPILRTGKGTFDIISDVNITGALNVTGAIQHNYNQGVTANYSIEDENGNPCYLAFSGGIAYSSNCTTW